MAGAVRGITPGTLTVATVGTVYVGAYLQTDTVTELQDPELLNPAAGTRGYGEPGALRERVTLVWGAQGDGTAGTFYPVWTIIDGSVMPKSRRPTSTPSPRPWPAMTATARAAPTSCAAWT